MRALWCELPRQRALWITPPLCVLFIMDVFVRCNTNFNSKCGSRLVSLHHVASLYNVTVNNSRLVPAFGEVCSLTPVCGSGLAMETVPFRCGYCTRSATTRHGAEGGRTSNWARSYLSCFFVNDNVSHFLHEHHPTPLPPALPHTCPHRTELPP